MSETENQLISIDAFKINATPSMVSANFGEMRQIIAKEVSERVSLVTPETIQPAKTLCADYRKTSKALMAAWKEKRQVSIADVLKADDEVKSLCKLLDDGADEISAQVKKIEQETKDLCLNLLVQERLLTWNQLGVTAEFCKATIDDLVKLGSLTTKGCLTKAAVTEVENRCKMDKAQQDKINSRLMELENRCLKAEIVPPLSPASIASFVYADDVVFYDNLDKVVNAEIDRKVESENRLKAKHEAELQKAIDVALRSQQAEANRIAREEAQKQREIETKAFQEKANAGALELAESTRRTVEEIKAEEPIEKTKPKEQGDYEDYVMTAIITKQFRAEKGSDTGYMEKGVSQGLSVEGYTVISCKVKRA